MITLKIGKAICPVCDVKNSKQSVLSVSGKLTTLWLFFVENKDLTKAKIGLFSFLRRKLL